MSGALVFIKEDLQISDLQVQILAGTLHACALPACMAAGRTSDYKGRRFAIILSSIIFSLGSILLAYGPSYLILIIGNCILGIAVGFALIIAPVYCAEISPPSYRGFLTSLPELSINIGLLLGYASNYFLEKLSLKLGWRMMLGAPTVPSLALAILMLKLVESPRWLIMQGRVGEARKVLLLVSNTKEEAEQRLKEIKVAVGIDENCALDIVQVSRKSRSGGGALKELFCKPSPPVRRILIAAIAIHAFLQLGGIGAILLYSPRIFEKTGITDKSMLMLATVGIGVSKVIFSFVSIFLLDKVGRRILLLVSAVGMVVTLLGLGICLTIVERYSTEREVWAINFTIIVTYVLVAFMTIGIGPVTWVYSAEIFPLRFRAQGLAVCVAVNRIANLIIITSFISIYKAITMGGLFFLLAAINALALWFYYTLPETKGRSLEDMETIFGGNSKLEI
uniref:Polyol transporter 3 n=2 Tax=Cajanus cajan TaxID=3821 RepID=A0A151TID1_CAJCA|nr:putative polyol transporter 3 [Cajanus cajan]